MLHEIGIFFAGMVVGAVTLLGVAIYAAYQSRRD